MQGRPAQEEGAVSPQGGRHREPGPDGGQGSGQGCGEGAVVCWPERPLHQQFTSGSEEQPKQAHTHTEQTCLPVTGHSRARFTPLPYCGFSQRPLPSTLPHLAVPCFGFPTIPPLIDDCIRATAAASQVAVPTAQLQDAKLLAPKSQAGLSSSSSCEQQQGMLCSGASSTLRKETSRA